MNYVERIKRCTTAEEALLLLASAIDGIIADQAEWERMTAAPDPWKQPLEWDEQLIVGRRPFESNQPAVPTQPVVDQSAIDATIAAISKTSDPDELRVLHAKLWLMRNPGRIPPAVVHGPAETHDYSHGEVVLKQVPSDRAIARREWARSVPLWEFIPLAEDQAVEAFVAGGPLWLYHGNRDAVMAMPMEMRRFLLEDIAEDSPAEAADIARDIMKSMDSVSQGDQVAAIQRTVDNMGSSE